MAILYLFAIPRSVGSWAVVVKLLFNPGAEVVYTPPPYESALVKRAAVLYKAAAFAVKFRTILK